MYALDTNSVVYFFRGEGEVAERLLSIPPRDVTLPSIVLYELELGTLGARSPKRRRAQLDEFVQAIRILPFGAREAQMAANIRAKLERAGAGIGPMDTLIAATALSHKATLVTHNLAEFRRVKGLQLEDWY